MNVAPELRQWLVDHGEDPNDPFMLPNMCYCNKETHWDEASAENHVARHKAAYPNDHPSYYACDLPLRDFDEDGNEVETYLPHFHITSGWRTPVEDV
jgi:hypothetical protein